MKYTVAYFTNRREPHFEWFVDAFVEQAKDDLKETQLVLVDYWLAPGHPHRNAEQVERRLIEMAAIVAGRCALMHLPPKPTPWQGKYRQTSLGFLSLLISSLITGVPSPIIMLHSGSTGV